MVFSKRLSMLLFVSILLLTNSTVYAVGITQPVARSPLLQWIYKSLPDKLDAFIVTQSVIHICVSRNDAKLRARLRDELSFKKNELFFRWLIEVEKDLRYRMPPGQDRIKKLKPYIKTAVDTFYPECRLKA